MGVLLIIAGLILLFGDPSVAEEDGAVRKTRAVFKGVATVFKDKPHPSEDFWGWLWWNSEGH